MLKDFYDIKSDPIVSLEQFYGPKKKILDKCLVVFSKVILDAILKKYDCKIIANIGACNGNNPIYSFNLGGEEIAVYLSSIGSAVASDYVIEANHLTGAYKFVMFGSCGSLDYNKTKGRFVIPTYSYRGEGLSYYFAPAKDYIKIRNANVVANIFKDLHIPYVKGKNWTTDCMLRETVNLMSKRKTEGCISVEMELAGVQSVCDFYKFELYDFLEAGDVLSESNYDATNLKDANHNCDKLFIALEIIKRI